MKLKAICFNSILELDFNESLPNHSRDNLLQTRRRGLYNHNFIGNPDVKNIGDAILVLS